MIKAAIYPLLKPLDRLLKFLIPVKTNRVCYQSYPDYSDNSYYVYMHALRTRSDIEHIWLLKDITVSGRILRDFSKFQSRADARGNTVRVVRRRSLTGYFLFLTSKYVFHTHGVYEFSSWAFKREIISLWHGMPIKCVGKLNKITPNPYPTFGTMHIATSHLFKYIVASAFSVSPDAVKVCGLPRCDALQYDDALGVNNKKVRIILGVPAEKKLILWMPTYRTEGVLNSPASKQIRTFLDDVPPWVLDELDHGASSTNSTIIVKLHGYDHLNNIDFTFKHKNIILLRSQEWLRHEVQLYDLIAASDALISDVSSVLIDYLVTHKPIGVLGFDEATYTRDLTLPMTLIMKSNRFIRLLDKASINHFFKQINDVALHEKHKNDISTLLYEPFDMMSAESILKEAGL